MIAALDSYAPAAGPEVITHLRQLAAPLKDKKVVHVNSTRLGGGVAEILHRLVPLKNELGLKATWQVITGGDEFFQVTKGFHNALQGVRADLSKRLLDVYVETNRENAERLRGELEEADFVFIHDPQPAALLAFHPERRGIWIWRCHIDVSRPYRPVWKFVRDQVRGFNASVFSLASFAQPLPHPQYMITPSIDPLSEKNWPLGEGEVAQVGVEFGLDPDRPVALQVSRFDRFKDPLGVIRAFRLVQRHVPLQLVLAGSEATDDPEGSAVLAEVREEAGSDPDIHVLLLPPDAHRTINALQRRADVVLQKSLREGFGLTVSEALWKRKPVIGGETGGIKLQVIPHHTGFLVNTPEGAALRIRQLLDQPALAASMGEKGYRHVRENFLLTRHLREYLTLMLGVSGGFADRIEIQP
jgi:trehalose synthase